jgi:hypothetical protein
MATGYRFELNCNLVCPSSSPSKKMPLGQTRVPAAAAAAALLLFVARVPPVFLFARRYGFA